MKAKIFQPAICIKSASVVIPSIGKFAFSVIIIKTIESKVKFQYD